MRAVKLLNLFSMSGPSATVKPIRPKIRATSSITIFRGWMAPRAGQRPGREQSKEGAEGFVEEDAKASVRDLRALSSSERQALAALPKAGRSSGETSFNCFIKAGIRPLRPRYLMRICSRAEASEAASMAAMDSAWRFWSSARFIVFT